MKKYFSTFFALLCFVMLMLCIGVGEVSSASSANVYGKVLRLHVVANSDSPEDQRLKYAVRDDLLETTQHLFGDCETVEQALQKANADAILLENKARDTLTKSGCNNDVKVVIGKEMYPEKEYGDMVFPEGEYLSVRVIIGEGNGQNWWCVLFPPLCNAAPSDAGAVMSSYGINDEEVSKLKNQMGGVNIFGCNVRFKFFDLFG